ncbi:MAG: hypothetical protein JXC36_05180 [Candidatus Atribacteria bacterium]|nr:hypothetical protein [Candidatus Atribacteria bacterium]
MGNIPVNDFRNFIISPRFATKIEEIEKSINKLNGVLFSKIVLAEDQEIKEVHVITKDFCSPKKITRDIESLLIAKHNISVDYRKISIAQVKDEKDYSHRLLFSDISVSSSDENLQVIVKLENNHQTFEGRINCANWVKNREYIIARAALDAISSYLNGKVFFQVDEIRKLKLDSKEVVLISVNLINSQGKENLVGAALVGDDPNETVVCAILKAVNRRILVK